MLLLPFQALAACGIQIYVFIIFFMIAAMLRASWIFWQHVWAENWDAEEKRKE